MMSLIPVLLVDLQSECTGFHSYYKDWWCTFSCLVLQGDDNQQYASPHKPHPSTESEHDKRVRQVLCII